MPKHQTNLFNAEPEAWELDDSELAVLARVVFTGDPPGPFDYRVPDALRDALRPGCRVWVPLGKGNKPRLGYCVQIAADAPMPPRGLSKLKEIAEVYDAAPLYNAGMLRLAARIAEHYVCDLGDVLEAMVPAGVRDGAGMREQTVYSIPTSVAARFAKLAEMKLPPKQLHVMQTLFAAGKPLSGTALASKAGCTQVPIEGLRKKGLIAAERKRLWNMEPTVPPVEPDAGWPLNDDQQQAYDAIHAALHAREYRTLVLHGVTGSGKTEVYIRAIEEVVRFGRQAIVLVPEISLTPQTRQRFRSRFPRVAVLHSHLSDAERHWHWRHIAEGKITVVVGARSAIFAPLPNLGLIVIDEEHDQSFKQDAAPRYHARDVARWRAELEQIPLVLGSATPALESWQAAHEGNGALIEMPRRVLDLPLPDVQTIDLRDEFRDRRGRGAISRKLHQAMAQTLQENGQIILLLNRRGFATHIQCPACGEAVKCPHCDISLTHHREANLAVCHYCDYQQPTPAACPNCNFEGIRYGGLGTQKLEMEVRARFPNAACLRMDSDTMQKPGSHEAALDRFRSGEVQILLGTQMIAKGLDFPNVTLVGVIHADAALHLPDFRATERTFQLVTQVAGRTGRGVRGGRVLVQTFDPDNPAVRAAVRHDYRLFAGGELPSRREYHYPPFATMARLVVRGEVEQAAEQFADYLAERLREQAEAAGANARILGPAAAPIAKLRNMHRFHLLLQADIGAPLQAIVRAATQSIKTPDRVQWIVDIDPLDML